MEQFKDIEGYEGLYQVSSLGRVISLPKMGGNGYKSIELKQDLSERPNSVSYHRVTLSSGGRTKRYSVHRLVAQAFIPNPKSKPFINHIDNNPSNNAVSNLEWCTPSENMVHAQKQGRLLAAIKAGGKATGEIRKAATQHRLQKLLGNRLVSIEPTVKKKTYVNYICLGCSGSFRARTDSPCIKVNGICNSCIHKKKI